MKTIGIHLDQHDLLKLIRACNQRAQDIANKNHLALAKQYDALASKLEVSLNVLANTQDAPENATGGSKKELHGTTK